MVPSSAVVSPKPSIPEGDDEDYEIVYEEIEEEIEIEVEEEVEEEDDVGADHVENGGDVEIGEDLTASSLKNLETDTGKILELDEQKDHRQSSSFTEEFLVSKIGDVKPFESREKEELYGNGGEISKYNQEKIPLNDSGEVNHAKTSPSIGDVNVTSTMDNTSGENDSAIASIMEKTNQSALEGVGNISPRLHAAKIRFRDPSPSAEIDRESKKIRMVCEFHAKGWCIRGKSCRFLHTKDAPDAVMIKSEALGREAASSRAFIPPLQSGDTNLSSETEKLALPEDGNYPGAPAREDRSVRHNLYLDNFQNYGGPPVQGILNARDGLEHHAYISSSMQQSIPQAFRSESDSLLRDGSFREPKPPKLEATFSSFDWQLSAPFCPSHEITRSILLKECGYNSADQKYVMDIQAIFSHSDQGSSDKNVAVQSSSPQGEAKLLNDVLAGDNGKENILSSSNDDEVKLNKTVDGTISEVGGSGTKYDIEADFRQDDHVQSDTKAFKYFQSALIESVKELVKPSWREGFLSKDAHKLIVKKAANKVLSSLPAHQIPSTEESVQSYLSLSQPKLAKLVEGYLNIYGKM
ncbi:uncharacterized protein LOC125212517 [Salvia hispanica]|uniref:uncharacterized protein LOC125212517 n=1 Tax=Salvia hispanica TaxID=49212 RepID=UPI00200972AA|nr:uncharacterized protein LOC125212517 [Salvia hispanica]